MFDLNEAANLSADPDHGGRRLDGAAGTAAALDGCDDALFDGPVEPPEGTELTRPGAALAVGFDVARRR